MGIKIRKSSVSNFQNLKEAICEAAKTQKRLLLKENIYYMVDISISNVSNLFLAFAAFLIDLWVSEYWIPRFSGFFYKLLFPVGWRWTSISPKHEFTDFKGIYGVDYSYKTLSCSIYMFLHRIYNNDEIHTQLNDIDTWFVSRRNFRLESHVWKLIL